ncbi:MAG: DNA replication/repair protein RecF [Ectothiorhodospira sp.]
MILARLDLSHLRLFDRLRMEPSPGLNLITGPNASGKTSLLEGIHLLATGRSFRSPRIGPLIRRGEPTVMVTGRLRGPSGETVHLGIRKGARGTHARIQGRRVRAQTELARLFPVQVIHPDSHELLAGPPGERRGFLDWGLFHSEADYLGILQGYRRALNQRNEALRLGAPDRILAAWEQEMDRHTRPLDRFRRDYLQALADAASTLRSWLPVEGALEWQYRPGWREGEDLVEVLAQGRGREREMGYTLWGPHRAEVIFRHEGVSLSQEASRGQQKTAVLLLRLAQVVLHRRRTGLPVVVMVDDLASELDPARRAGTLDLLRNLGCQVFMTALQGDTLDLSGWEEMRMFHVEHGRLRED